MIWDVQVQDPVKHGAWINVPIDPCLRVALKGMCVMQNSLVGQGTRGGSASVRSLLLGTDDYAMVAVLIEAEEFLHRAARTLWSCWFPGQTFGLELVPHVKKNTTLGPFRHELRVYSMGKDAFSIKDDAGTTCVPRDISVGDFVDVDIHLLGLWCSASKCGLKHRMDSVTLLRAKGNALEARN